MSRDPALALDILLACEDALSFTADLDRTGFAASKLHQAATIRCLEIMGRPPAAPRPSSAQPTPTFPGA